MLFGNLEARHIQKSSSYMAHCKESITTTTTNITNTSRQRGDWGKESLEIFQCRKRSKNCRKKWYFKVPATPAIASKLWEQLPFFFVSISTIIIKGISYPYKPWFSWSYTGWLTLLPRWEVSLSSLVPAPCFSFDILLTLSCLDSITWQKTKQKNPNFVVELIWPVEQSGVEQQVEQEWGHIF